MSEHKDVIIIDKIMYCLMALLTIASLWVGLATLTIFFLIVFIMYTNIIWARRTEEEDELWKINLKNPN